MAVDSLSKKKARKPDVSDHAIIRYVERVLGLERKEIENDILSERFTKVWKICRGSHAKIPFRDGFRAVVQENRVVTILGRREKRNAKKK